MDSASLLLCGFALALLPAFLIDRVRRTSKACPTLITFMLALHDQPFVQLDDIPAVGPSGLFLSYYGAAKFILNARSMVQQGYDQVRHHEKLRIHWAHLEASTKTNSLEYQ